MELGKQYGQLGKDIELQIKQLVKEEVSIYLQPITVLKQFEAVEVLTLDEVCEVLRVDSKEKMREACKRGEFPYLKLGRDYIFPKKLVVEYLLGTWQEFENKIQPEARNRVSLEEKIAKFLS